MEGKNRGIREDLDDINVSNVRQSIHTIKTQLDSKVKGEFDYIEDEGRWNLSNLKKEFRTKEIRDIFKIYTQRLNQSFFALLMLTQTVLFTVHSCTILIYSKNSSENLIELVLYGFMACFSFTTFFITDECFFLTLKKRSLKLVTTLFYILLLSVNITVPLFYFMKDSKIQLRPAYSVHIIICCYVFFYITNIGLTIILGILTTVVHVLLLIFVTYNDLSSSMLNSRIFSDVVYLICINGLGVYYRYLNEIIKRKGFLDRTYCVVTKRHLEFQKKQEEHLMETLIPSYVINNIRNNILLSWDNLENINSNVGTTSSFEYKTSFTQTFENVTILYADVVNYTEMTVKLKITELLETLNELFGKFDDASEVLKVLRVKFLGDCYYCVSGLPPEPPENHAEACVDLGLEMIKIIAEVRKRRDININMRIGVHTGRIISGIIGYQKFHFDIWSKDVSLANQMETEGQPGKVHLTQHTKKLLRKHYNIEPTNKGEIVPQFKKSHIKTYLISPENETNNVDKKNSDISTIYVKNTFRMSNSIINTKRSVTKTIPKKVIIDENNNKTNSDKTIVQYYNIIETSHTDEEKEIRENSPSVSSNVDNDSRSSDPRDSKRRTAFMNSNIKRYKETMNESYKEMREAIETLSLTKYQQWFKYKEINPITLLFTNMENEKNFIKMNDPLFKYYLVSGVFLVIFLYVLQNLTLDEWNWNSWSIYTCLTAIVFIFLPLTWFHHFFKQETGEVYQFLDRLSQITTRSFWLRLIIYLIVCFLFSVSVFSDIIYCKFRYSENSIQLLISQKKGVCIVPWHMTQTCILAVIMSFLFLRMLMSVKFIYGSLIMLIYSICVWNYADDFLKENDETINYLVSAQVAHILSVFFVTFTLHLIDRQTEYMNRLDFLWNKSLDQENSKIESRYIINKMLLNKVLPEHLTEMYLDIRRPPAALYHENYSNAAVMFASVVGYEIEDISDDALLTMMAEIIGDFDKLILKSDFGHKIEKIKVAKWTYMAACGISPGHGEYDQKKTPIHVEALLKCAAAMMSQLSKLNQGYPQDFKLRIGISNGEIVAGVVGSKKPLYDIWGDPVNMASRMDTTGEANKIQVLEKTAKIIKSVGYKCTLRGNTLVKGLRTPVATYFVDMNENFDLIRNLD